MIAKDAIIITSRDDVGPKGTGVFANRVTVPQFQIFNNPTIKISDVKSRRFNIIDRNVRKAKQQIMAQEDASIFEALENIWSKEE